MRLSQQLFVTLREEPAEAEITSHKLLLRAGYIRRIGSGVYVYLPLMWRVLQKISQITREEMNATGAAECLLPQLQPAELWRESGRWDTYTKAEGIMFSLKDRQDRELGLGPTHEEVITAIAKDMIRSYRQLPIHLYQIQSKFRDEIRPRFGLMRGREFIMKDGYSFHTDQESLLKTYQDMDQAYRNIFSRCGLEFCAVDADSGAIGGSGSQEFMVLAEAGEDEVLYTADGKYSANVEKAISVPVAASNSPFTSYEKRESPHTETIAKLCEYFKCSPTVVVKNILYEAVYDSGILALVLVNIRGDQEINEVKLQNELTKLAPEYQANTLLSFKVAEKNTANKWAVKPLSWGYLAPNLSNDYLIKNEQIVSEFICFVDETAVELKNFVTGANETGYHVVGANWGQEFTLPQRVVNLRKAKAGDLVSTDSTEVLLSARGIEVGHIFQLGNKYSQAMGATYTNEGGEEIPLMMGCYGIGVSRLAQAAVEQNHDKNGIIWPVTIAPYQVIVVIPNTGDAQQVATAEQIYTDLNNIGIETMLDDRDERAGVKFKDADLIGIPYRVVTGRSLAEGKVEVVERANGQSHLIPVTELITTLTGWLCS
jgi:prolyl-tRNA synthetase